MKSKLALMSLVGMLAFAAVPITVEAHVPDNVDTSVIDEDEDVAEEEYGPLTPEGNLTIVDDYGAAESSGKQFITVTTKNGNIFYLIIDRDDQGENTVHFLNLVDERDLMALLEDEEKEEIENEKADAAAAVEKPDTTETEDEQTEEKPEDTKKKSGNNVLVFCIILGMAGVAGFYFYSNKGSFLKKKKGPIIDDGEEYIEIPKEQDDTNDDTDSSDRKE